MLSVATFSSSEDEELYTLIELNALRRELRQQSDIFALPHSKFVSYFRLNKQAFKYVLENITPKLKQPTRTTHLPNILKLATTIRILTEGSYQKGCGNDYNIRMSQSSVSNALRECIDVMYKELCHKWIKFSKEEAEKNKIKTSFFNKSGFPGTIGCIDGTHINTISPAKEEQFKYRNRKGFFSLNTTVVCDHEMRIRYISSHHHSLVWNISDLKRLLRQNYYNGERNTWLLGDAGYALEKFLITPFRSPTEGSEESHFNYIHARARNIVERTIGVLKNRFRCILGGRQLHYTPDMAAKITALCAALHNICIHFKTEMHDIDIVPETPTTTSEVNDDSSASNIRLSIMQSLNI